MEFTNFSRRNLIKLGAVAAGTSALTAGVNAWLNEPVNAEDYTNLAPDAALQLLMEGNKRFTTKRLEKVNQGYDRLLNVAQTQKPFAAILGCADSRVPAEIIFDRGFGDLFVCRVAGNVATPEEIGSLEFGSAVLGVKTILVLGHKRCGAVDATLKGAQVPGQIGSLLAAIKPAVPKAAGKAGDPLENTCKENILLQVEKLKTSSVMSQLIKEGKLLIAGGYYDLDTGEVSIVR